MKLSYLFNAVFLLISFCLSGQSNILNSTTPEQIGVKNIDQLQSDLDSYLEYEFIDDRDILWSKIVYEKIDLNERLNFPLLFPIDDELYENTRKSLWRVLKENILNGNITKIYSDVNDNFRYPLSPDEVKDIVATKVDFGDGELIPKEVGSDDITGYRIKGMWYFDKRRGELMYRLLGLMPIGEDLKNLDGDEEKKTNLFWIWYPSIREILHQELVFNDTSNANRISFDQLLLSRRFSSYIYKEDNLYGDRPIQAYKKKGLESILESERIKKEILDFEQDLWNR
ncbi:MAG: gliding motility protein GldN [Flavobacteriaceae bacterium]|nr:gliding motility protein GldN [Flavobacteriaceae bacterium]|tara:strand:- start:16046 stop:16897 length:852 start_codon:yes stop_codon:yes gene_type:complete